MTTSGSPEETGTSSIPDRAKKYLADVERVVREVGEHPQYELKRACSLSSTPDRMEFVKDVQSIATSRIDSEKFLVIGADQATKAFVPLQNPGDFDDARIRQILEKYLSPLPQFEIFSLQSATGEAFVLFVFPKQRTRRIVARVTVDDPSDPKPRVLLREGDLWTKGASTAKRLARPEDWDDIYAEHVESEAETRARRRTAHFLDQVVAQERIRSTGGSTSVPAFLSDDDLKPFVEEICVSADQSKLRVLLERYRDDLIEGWHGVGAYNGAVFMENPATTIPGFRDRIREYRDSIFRPAIQRLTYVGTLVVKYEGSPALLRQVVSLASEVFENSRRMDGLKNSTAYGQSPQATTEHLSHTMPALDCLTAFHLIGAYVTKRRRFQYVSVLLEQTAGEIGSREISVRDDSKQRLIAFWPWRGGWGEPELLHHASGRLEFCMTRVVEDPALFGLFGSKESTLKALCEYEMILELNSFLAVKDDKSPASVDFVKSKYGGIDFSFWPSFVAFSIENVSELAAVIYDDLVLQGGRTAVQMLFDASLVKFLTSTAGRSIFLWFIDDVKNTHDRLMMQLHRFGDFASWPRKLANALEQLRLSGA